MCRERDVKLHSYEWVFVTVMLWLLCDVTVISYTQSWRSSFWCHWRTSALHSVCTTLSRWQNVPSWCVDVHLWCRSYTTQDNSSVHSSETFSLMLGIGSPDKNWILCCLYVNRCLSYHVLSEFTAIWCYTNTIIIINSIIIFQNWYPVPVHFPDWSR